MNRVTRIFLDADLRCQHNGLSAIARKHGKRVDHLKSGEHILFVNKARNRVKMFSPCNVLHYIKTDTGKKLELYHMQLIVKVFGDGLTLEYTKDLDSVIHREFKS